MIWIMGLLAAYLVLSFLYSRYVLAVQISRYGRNSIKWYDYPMLLPIVGLVFFYFCLHYITKGKK